MVSEKMQGRNYVLRGWGVKDIRSNEHCYVDLSKSSYPKSHGPCPFQASHQEYYRVECLIMNYLYSLLYAKTLNSSSKFNHDNYMADTGRFNNVQCREMCFTLGRKNP